ncbi:MAG: PQQ-like beta-propeller repeat protein, partial [Gemmataceae bacterium]|nr:PQQ-like beta-propeller repeat protein [Gemmataceae bacterium]
MASLVLLLALAADWPQWLGPDRDGVWREDGILDTLPKEPKILWRTPVGGGYAGPAVAGGKVYVNDRQLASGEKEDDNPFARSRSKGTERLLCLDAKTGKELWKHEYECRYAMSYPSGPRTTPVVAHGKVWSLGAMGDLACLDAAKGTVVWAKNLMKEYKAPVPVWGFSAHLLLDGKNLITLAAKDPAVVALDRDTGKEVWRSLKIDSADIGYCPPVIHTFGGKRQLIVWHPESVNGLDPATGKELWSHEWKVQSNLSVSMPRKVGEDGLFLTAFYNGCRLLKVGKDGAELAWKRHGRSEQVTDGLHSIMPTPVIVGKHAYGVCSYGELRCLDLEEKGKRIWEDLTATGTGGKRERWANAFLVPHGERWFIFNEQGELITAKLTPKGYEETSRAKILEPTGQLAGRFTDARKV